MGHLHGPSSHRQSTGAAPAELCCVRPVQPRWPRFFSLSVMKNPEQLKNDAPLSGLYPASEGTKLTPVSFWPSPSTLVTFRTLKLTFTIMVWERGWKWE